MSTLFDTKIVEEGQNAADFIVSLLQASTEYAIIGIDMDGAILLWNEGARRLYGYEPDEVVGKLNSSMLHMEQDVLADKPREMLAAALSTGKWEGAMQRRKKNGAHFSARVVITPRRDNASAAIGYLLISKDISDEIRLTEELKATQLYTRSLIESNIDALMTTDPLGIISDVNKQMEDLTGHTRAALIGMPFKNYFTDPARAEQGIKLVLREGKVTNYELTARAKDGRQTVVSYNASTFHDGQNRLQGVFAAARDITEQKMLESQLRDSQAYNRGLIESSVDGLITVDPSGTISDVNARMCQMVDTSREDLIGTPFADYFVDADRATNGVKKTLDEGIVTDYVLSMAARDGAKQIEVSFNASVFRDPAGTILGIFASARDITEQLRLQIQLADERAYNRGLIEASLDGLITVDPMLIITDVNDTMCRMSGYAREELIGTSFPHYFTDDKHAAGGVRMTLDQGAVTNYELTLKTSDQQERLVSFNAAIFKDPSGLVRGIFASARDITEQSRLQTLLIEERAYNRGLIEASVDGLITVDEAMLITDVNDTMCRMVGRGRSQLIGSLFPGYFVEREQAAQGVELTFQQGFVTNYVLTLHAAEERQLPVSFNAAVFKDSAGKVRGIFASARDITAQQQLETQLQVSQFYTRSLIESNIDALMTTDSMGIISDVNQQMAALTGCQAAELIGTPFKNYFTDPERAEQGIKLVLHEGKVTNYELTARATDSHQTVVSYNATTLHDQTGKLQGVFASARDITEQKKLEQQLREQQTYLRGLIEASVDGLITVDPAGTITDINARMCQMTGYSRAELFGSPFTDYFTEPERARAVVLETFEQGIVTEYALTLVSRTRRQLQVSFNASVYSDADGKAQGIFASARDITDRVRLEEQFREQQTYLRGLIEASVEGLVTVDPQGFITDVNDQMCRMTGYERKELIGSSFRRYFTETEQAHAGVMRTFAESIVTNYELVLKTKSARKATVSFNASIYRGAEGQIEGIFASARDISDQARLQSQLTEQQAYNRSLIEASADAQFAIAPDGIITDVNAEAIRLTGYSRKHLINSPFLQYFTAPELATEGVQKTLREQRVLGYELELITRHGRRITVSFNAGVFSDARGQTVGILAAARDISAQKVMEQQLRDQQFYTRSLIESNSDALMTTDPLGIISDVNGQMVELTGVLASELIGTPFKNYFTDPALAEQGIKLVLQEGKVSNYELTARAQSGLETVVSYNASTFHDRDGKLQGVFAAARDVTERKRFEQTLQEKNIEMENANLAKDRFLASMSHELRTPLNAIIGFTGTLLMKLPGPLTAGQDKQLKIIQTSGRHLLSLINDLLDVAKIEAGNVELDVVPVVCQEVVKEVIDTLLTLAEQKGLTLTAEAPLALITLRTDRRALNQILLNFVNNAIKFTETGSIRLTLTQRHENGHVLTQFSVTDSGVGIRPEDQARLFQAFTQLDSGSTRRYEGTGLGLYLSQKLASLVGGSLSFHSEYGKGSTFVLELKS